MLIHAKQKIQSQLSGQNLRTAHAQPTYASLVPCDTVATPPSSFRVSDLHIHSL